MKIKCIKAISPRNVAFEECEEDLQLLRPCEILVENMVSHISTGTELACVSGSEDWFPLPKTLGYTSNVHIK